jgi:hypothetical protein
LDREFPQPAVCRRQCLAAPEEDSLIGLVFSAVAAIGLSVMVTKLILEKVGEFTNNPGARTLVSGTDLDRVSLGLFASMPANLPANRTFHQTGRWSRRRLS